MDGTISAAILIRYDGRDADRHEIDLGDLGESLKGLSRIISVTGNFAATDKFVQHKDALSVRVVASPPEAHCFEIMAWLKWGAENPYFSATVSGLTVALIGYVFKRSSGQREEMKHLKDSLDRAITELGGRDRSTVERLLDTVDRMVDALRPAVRQAVTPIGQTASTLTIGDGSSGNRVVLDQSDRDAIMQEGETEITSERTFSVEITGLSMENGSCKLALDDDPEARVTGQVTDPQVMRANNPYALAMAGKRRLNVRAKALLRDGEIEKLYISDIVQNGSASTTPAGTRP